MEVECVPISISFFQLPCWGEACLTAMNFQHYSSFILYCFIYDQLKHLFVYVHLEGYVPSGLAHEGIFTNSLEDMLSGSVPSV